MLPSCDSKAGRVQGEFVQGVKGIGRTARRAGDRVHFLNWSERGRISVESLQGNCFRARRTGNGQNGDGRRGVRGSVHGWALRGGECQGRAVRTAATPRGGDPPAVPALRDAAAGSCPRIPAILRARRIRRRRVPGRRRCRGRPGAHGKGCLTFLRLRSRGRERQAFRKTDSRCAISASTSVGEDTVCRQDAGAKLNCKLTARKLLSRPPHRKRSERGRASGSEGV